MVLTAIVALLGGCDISGDESDGGPGRPPERAEEPAKLPPRWRTIVNRSAGFTIGLPPVWVARQNGSSTVLTSPDKQVALSISADRTDEALSVPLMRFALGTARSLSGFERIEIKRAAAFPSHYPAIAVEAVGLLERKNILQRLELVILRREGLAAYPVLAAVNTGSKTPFSGQIDPIIRSLRGRPIEVTG